MGGPINWVNQTLNRVGQFPTGPPVAPPLHRTSIGYYVYTILTSPLFIFIKKYVTIGKIKQVIICNNNRNINNNISYNIYDKNNDDIKLKVIFVMYEFQVIIVQKIL